MAYVFYLDKIKLPVTPESLNVSIKNQNTTVNLINDGEVNILKTPGLSEVSFSFLIPSKAKHFTQGLKSVKYYLDAIEKLKINAKQFQFIVYREGPDSRDLFKTNMTVSIEDYKIVEDAENRSDVVININLKQYRKYGTKIIEIKKTSNGNRAVKKDTKKSTKKKTKYYTVRTGDCLWNIARKFYGNGADWKKIYNANKPAIEKDARRHGYKSSSNGHWIWKGLKLIIP